MDWCIVFSLENNMFSCSKAWCVREVTLQMPNFLLFLLIPLRASAHKRLPQRWKSRNSGYFLAVLTDGERNAHFAHDLAQSVCTLHKHKALALSQHVLRPYSSRNLDVARRICNYRLTWARRILLCAFGIVCNKWRIFHRVTDVCPDFCNVTVKTCCILHNFVCQTDSLQFQGTLYECPLKSIKAVGNRCNVTERIWGGGLRGQECLSVGEPGRGLFYQGLMCRRRVWRWAPPSIGTPLRHMGGVPFTRNSEG